MKNLKYAVLIALLLSTMVAGCNSSWNPFRKKPVVTEPPVTSGLASMDGTGTDLRPGPIVEPPVVIVDDPPPPPPPAAAGAYTIKKKDTLWSIAVALLGDGQRYRDIISANPGLDPQKLAIGQTINIPPK